MKNIFNFIRKDEIGNPPWDYYFLKNLDEKEYPKYLAKIFKYRTGEKLPLKYDFKNKSWIIDKKKCKTFNQKIQWLKLYGVTDLIRKCTDKVAVRDYVAEKIGSEYLKPVLQVIPSLNCDCHVIARNNSTLGDEAIQGKRSQKDVYENSEIKSNNQLDCHGSQNDIEPRNDGKIDALHLLNQKDTSASNSCLPQYDETITDINMQSHSEPDVNSGVKNLYTSSRVDFSQPKQDVTTYFDQIDWKNLPNSFVIKCNHGCKWQFIIKDKEAFLQNKRLFDIVKRNITGWLEMDYSFWGGFEMQYKINNTVIASDSEAIQLIGNNVIMDCHVTQNVVVPRNDKYIEPKILIEPLIRENINLQNKNVHVYCFSENPQYIIKLHSKEEITIYDKQLNIIEDIFSFREAKKNEKAEDIIYQSVELSTKLAKNFKFVRIDWMLHKNKLYFEEMTFSPYSGFNNFINKNQNLKIGNLLVV